MEKKKPTYDLDGVRTWAASSKFVATGTAIGTAMELGFGSEEMVALIQTIRREHFNKSMTSYSNHREWQDVYHVPSDAGVLYVKFRSDAVTEFLLLSFKEKDNG